jgi:hypothetical protein
MWRTVQLLRLPHAHGDIDVMHFIGVYWSMKAQDWDNSADMMGEVETWGIPRCRFRDQGHGRQERGAYRSGGSLRSLGIARCDWLIALPRRV